MGGKDDDVTRNDLDLLVDIGRHTGQGRHGLSLASCRDQNHLVRRVILQLLHLNKGVARIIDVPDLNCRPDDIDHRPAFQADFPLILSGAVDDLLHTVDIRSKGRDNQSLLRVLREDSFKGRADCPFGHRKARPLRVRTVAKKSQYALFADFRESLQVNHITEDRRIIHLEVACMHNDACR